MLRRTHLRIVLGKWVYSVDDVPYPCPKYELRVGFLYDELLFSIAGFCVNLSSIQNLLRESAESEDKASQLRQ
jgi:hypothetical protein